MSSNIHLVKMDAYKPPIIKEDNRDEWVEYGDDNNHFQWIIDRYVNSSTNNAVINNIIKLIYGKGLKALDANKKPNDYAQMISLLHPECIKNSISDFKMLGQFALQIIYSKDREVIAEVNHIPIQLLRAEKCNEEGEITGYYYSDNWSDTKKYEPVRYSAFGMSNDDTEILYTRNYSSGRKYYSYVDYQGSIGYALLEQEITDYLINDCQNSFSGTKIINFNNGVPDEEQRETIKRDVMNKLTGSNGQKVIVAFNHDETKKTTIDDVSLNNAPEHYNYLSEEAVKKIMLGHNVTSPLLFGISSSNGFSSNADELKNSFILYYNMVIKPYQDTLLDTFNMILNYNNVNLKLYFETLKPLEFTDPGGEVIEEDKEHSTLSKQDDPLTPIADALIDLGEHVDENWLLIDEFDVDYDDDDIHTEHLMSLDLNKQDDPEPETLLKRIINLVSTGTARPNSKSEQDDIVEGAKFITRYIYNGKIKTNSREFCQKMIGASKVYRKEDILQMSDKVVNKGWGPRGADKYNIWLFKGGGNCGHIWRKQVYVNFEGTGIDVKSPLAQQIAVKKAENAGYKVKNNKLVGTKPKNMPNNGFLK